MPKRKGPRAENGIITISKSAVPEYLRDGELYNSLDDDETQEFTVPTSCCKPDSSVKSAKEMVHILNSLDYWMANTVPEALIERALLHSNIDKVAKQIHDRLTLANPLLQDLRRVCRTPPLQRIAVCIALGRLDFAEHLRKQGHVVPKDAWSIAAAAGRIEGLRYVRGLGCPLPEDAWKLCESAAWKGSVECLQYLWELGCWWGDAMAFAVKGRNMECVRAAIKLGCPVDSRALIMAVETGTSEALEWLLSAAPPYLRYDVEARRAATLGRTACLQILSNSRFPPLINNAMVLCAANSGSVECLRFCCERIQGDLKLRPQAAALAGSIDCIVYLHGMGAAWSTEVTAAAAQGGHLDCLRYLHEQGCPWSAEVCTGAARQGKLECLMYAHEQGCPWDTSTTCVAAIHGHLPCLQYAHQHGCSMEFDIAVAAYFDHVECLEYGIRNGCEWNEEVFDDIVEFGEPGCVDVAWRLRELFDPFAFELS